MAQHSEISHRLADRVTALAPGLAMAGAVAAVAWLLQRAEVHWLGQPLLEALVLAILLGLAWRNTVGVQPRLAPGLCYCGKQLLELAVLLLGGTMNLGELLAGGPRLLLGVGLAVGGALLLGTLVSQRLLGLPRKPAILIAVGNAICGNSAIAAVAPLIGASAAEVAGAIAFTAVLGVGLVLALPHLLLPLLHYTHRQYGVLVGMTVYAVPQVLAASFPVSEQAGETATLVKLTRVLLLAPTALYFSLSNRQLGGKRPSWGQLLPWFIGGFLLMAGLRTVGIIPAPLGALLKEISRLLTIVAMAALGLGVDLKALRAAGLRTTLAVLASLTILLVLSIALIHLLALG